MDKLTEKYRIAVAEQIGTHTLRILHNKPTLWGRFLEWIKN